MSFFKIRFFLGRPLGSLPVAGLLSFLLFSGSASAQGMNPAGAKTAPAPAVAKKPASPPPDVLVFANGDQLSGKFVRVVDGTVSFHSDELGDISVTWDKVRELRSGQKVVVLESKPGVRAGHYAVNAPEGQIRVSNQTITVEGATASATGVTPSPAGAPAKGDTISVATPATPPGAAAPAPVTPSPLGTAAPNAATASAVPAKPSAAPGTISIPVKNAQYVLDQATFDHQVRSEPNFFSGWNGSATAGVQIIQGTQQQYTYTSAVTLIRTVPTVAWLPTRNRSTADFSSSYGKITQPAYTDAGVFVPASFTKTAIYHADAERDTYFTTQFYSLGQVAFDHNFAQGLDLQQIYGAGIGWTAIKRPNQQLDLKATVQYEKQLFLSMEQGSDENLIGSTFSANYLLKLHKNIVFNQQIAYIPAYNVERAYSGNESNTLTFPAYKNLSFTVGTIDSYLNDPPPAIPPTTRNSFQFTMGITYNFKSKY